MNFGGNKTGFQDADDALDLIGITVNMPVIKTAEVQIYDFCTFWYIYIILTQIFP